MVYEAPSANFEVFSRGMQEMGGIVEERIQGRDFLNPSVQLRISPLDEVEILSTHDQLLGGPSGGSFHGSKLPANPGYGLLLAREAAKIGERLADLGALGRFAVDFVVVRNADDEWEAYAIEINLRMGGTTHPFQILQFLTDGSFDPEDGVFRAPSGQKNTTWQAITWSRAFIVRSRPTIYSTSSFGTGCISTKPSRPAYYYTCCRR